MRSTCVFRLAWPTLLLVLSCFDESAKAASPVWRVTGPTGGTTYLGGSWHFLRQKDYPLPPAFNRAFDASTRLAFEIHHSPAAGRSFEEMLVSAGRYSHGDELKKHVDPRTYDYLRRVLARSKLPEQKLASYRPWYISFGLEGAHDLGFSHALGVEQFLAQRAQANAKPITGLEAIREHVNVFAGLNDRESEAYLLVAFTNLDRNNSATANVMDAWRRGDAEAVWQYARNNYRDFPGMTVRLLDNRNRNWIPKIEKFLQSGQTYFVVVGAAHMGGPNGLLALLRARGCKIEQL